MRRATTQMVALRRLAVGQYVRMAVGLAASPFLARALGPSDRGVWALVATFDVATTLVLASGMPRALGYYLLQCDGDDDEPVEQANGALVRIVIRSLALGVFLFVALFTAGLINPATLSLVALLCTTPSTALNLAARQVAAMTGRDRTIPFIDSGPAVVQAFAIVALFLTDSLDLSTGFIVYVSTSAMAGLPALLVWPSWRRHRPSLEFRRYAMRSLPTNVGQLLQAQIDKFAVLMLGREALGVYAVGSTLSNVVTPLYQAVGTDRFRDTSHGASARGKSRLLTTWFFSVLIGVAAFFAIPVVYGDPYREASSVALVLCVGSIGFGMFLLERAVLDAKGRPDASSFITIVHLGAMLAVVPAIALTLGLFAAAVSTAVLHVFRGVLSVVVGRRTGPPSPSANVPPV